MTITILAILLLAATGLTIWTARVILTGIGIPWLLRLSYCLVVAMAAVAAYFTTYCYDYYPNERTHILGWPVFRVILLRKTPTGPWLDYFGPTILLAYPLNLVLYLLLPSVLFLWLARRRASK